jgi:DNA-binding transcriptional LysR family regulator
MCITIVNQHVKWRFHMDLNWLQDFISLENTRSFTQAGHQRHITQSALSRRIKALEEWLETPLIDRTRYPIQLTPAGDTFLPLARLLITQLQQTREGIRQSATSGDRVFRIAAPHSIASNHLARRLAQLYRDDPTLQARVFSDNVAMCFDLLSQGVCEFLINYRYQPISMTLDPDRFISVDIGQEKLMPVAESAVARENGWCFPGSPEATLPLLTYGTESFLGAVVSHIIGSGSARGPERLWLRTRHTDALAEAVKGMCVSGAGIAWLPESMVSSDLRSGRLIRLDDGEWTREMHVSLIAPTDRADAAADAFWHALQHPLPPPPQ